MIAQKQPCSVCSGLVCSAQQGLLFSVSLPSHFSSKTLWPISWRKENGFGHQSIDFTVIVLQIAVTTLSGPGMDIDNSRGKACLLSQLYSLGIKEELSTFSKKKKPRQQTSSESRVRLLSSRQGTILLQSFSHHSHHQRWEADLGHRSIPTLPPEAD